MTMQDVVHDLLLEHGYESPKDRVVDMVCYIIPTRIKDFAEKWGWDDPDVKYVLYSWMKTHVQKGY